MFEINLSMYNYKYYVNEAEKTVVAKLELDVDRIDEATLLILSLSRTRNVQLPDYFIGVAHCKDSDTWDVKVGKKIARAKAKRTYKRAMLNCVKATKKFLEQTNATVAREEAKYKTDVENLTTLIKGTYNK